MHRLDTLLDTDHGLFDVIWSLLSIDFHCSTSVQCSSVGVVEADTLVVSYYYSIHVLLFIFSYITFLFMIGFVGTQDCDTFNFV